MIPPSSLCHKSSKLHKGYRRKSLNVKRGKDWRAQGDDFRTFLGEFVSRVPQRDVPVEDLLALDCITMSAPRPE